MNEVTNDEENDENIPIITNINPPEQDNNASSPCKSTLSSNTHSVTVPTTSSFESKPSTLLTSNNSSAASLPASDARSTKVPSPVWVTIVNLVKDVVYGVQKKLPHQISELELTPAMAVLLAILVVLSFMTMGIWVLVMIIILKGQFCSLNNDDLIGKIVRLTIDRLQNSKDEL